MCACAVVVNKLIVGQNNFRFKYGNVATQKQINKMIRKKEQNQFISTDKSKI